MTKDNTRALNGNKNYGGTGNGALYAAVTSAPATTMEWRPEMERDVKVQQPVWHSGMENEIVVNQLDGRRHSLDGDHDKLADDILKIFDDVMNNRDTDNGELGFAERIASRISDMMKTAGITSFAQAAIMMVAERESKTKNKDLWSEIVERLTEEGERKKNQDNILGDFAMDARAQRRQREQEELEEHRTQMHTMGGVTMSGAEWARFADDMRNNERIRNSMRDYLLRQGVPPKDIDKTLEDFSNAAAAMAKPPSQRTPADLALIRRASNDPNFRGAIAAAQNEMRTGDNLSSQRVQTARTSESQDVSVDTGKDILAGTLPQSLSAANAMAKAPSQRTADDLAAIHRANNETSFRGVSRFAEDDSKSNRYMEARPSVRFIPDDFFTRTPEEIVKAEMEELRAMSEDPRSRTIIGSEPPKNLMVRDSSFSSSTLEGNVRSGIDLNASFAQAKNATVPLDNPSVGEALSLNQAQTVATRLAASSPDSFV